LYSVKKKGIFHRMLDQWDLQILVIIPLILIFVFSYIPIYGILMAFQEFRLGDFPGFSQWVGFKQFITLFKSDAFPKVLRNTLAIGFLKIVINFPVPILFAVMINELRGKIFKKSVQTISYLPHFISWVVAAKLMFDFFSVDGGAVNTLLVNLHILKAPVPYFGKPEYFWGMAVVTDLWKELGWNSIIFLAAIAGIDSEMYEAADIDGASRLKKMWYITIAAIMPTIVLLLIFTVGRLLDANFDQIMQLTNMMGNPILRETADVIDTNVYRVGISQARFSYGAATGLFKAVINFGLLLSVNKLADRLTHTAVL